MGCLPLPGPDVAIFLVLGKIKLHYCVIFSGVSHGVSEREQILVFCVPVLLTKQPQLPAP